MKQRRENMEQQVKIGNRKKRIGNRKVANRDQ